MASIPRFFMTINGERILFSLATLLLAVSTATITVAYYRIHGPTLHALMLSSLIWLFLRQRRRIRLNVSSTTYLLAAIFFLFALVAVLSAGRVGFNTDALNRLEHFIYFLAAVSLIPFLLAVRLRTDWFWYAIAASALLSGLYAWWEMHTLGHAFQLATGLEYRASGSKGKAISFGNIATLTTVLSTLAACVFYASRRRGTWFFIIASISGFYASLASGTRGAWIFLPTALIVICIYLLQQFPTQRRRILVSMLVLVVSGGGLLIQSDQIQERFSSAMTEIQSYVPGAGVILGNSLGERFEMWRAAWLAYQEHPVLGIGVGQLNTYFQEAAARGLISQAIAEFDHGNGHTHAHNDYIHAMATRGFLGLISLLLLYLVPLLIFIRTAVVANGQEARGIGYAGILFILGYLQFSLTDSILLMRMTAGYFVLICSWLLAMNLQVCQEETPLNGRLPSS